MQKKNHELGSLTFSCTIIQILFPDRAMKILTQKDCVINLNFIHSFMRKSLKMFLAYSYFTNPFSIYELFYEKINPFKFT